MQSKFFLEKMEKQIDEIFNKENFLNIFKEKNLDFKLDINSSDLEYIKSPAIEIIKRGGKRIRPLIMILISYSLAGEDQELDKILYKLSLLLELPHSGSLIIDDIEDNALLRRGETAIHLMYGIDNSINTGNLIYFLPTKIIKNLNLTAEQKILVYENFLTTLTNLHLGQGIDIKAHNSKHIPSINEYISLIELKTGALFGMSGFLAAVATNNINIRHELYNTFLKLGVYFQIIDDVKNITNGIDGKDFGDDLTEGKKSLPIILFLNEFNLDPKLIEELENFKNKNPKDIQNEILEFTNKIKLSSSIKEALKISEKYYSEIINEINSYNFIRKYKETLIELINSIKGQAK